MFLSPGFFSQTPRPSFSLASLESSPRMPVSSLSPFFSLYPAMTPFSEKGAPLDIISRWLSPFPALTVVSRSETAFCLNQADFLPQRSVLAMSSVRGGACDVLSSRLMNTPSLSLPSTRRPTSDSFSSTAACSPKDVGHRGGGALCRLAVP